LGCFPVQMAVEPLASEHDGCPGSLARRVLNLFARPSVSGLISKS
jgi:hypothetical protein